MIIEKIREIQRKYINDKNLLPQDRIRLGGWINKIKRTKNADIAESQFNRFQKQLEFSLNKKEKHLFRPKINYPSILPITSKVNEIKKLIESSGNNSIRINRFWENYTASQNTS
jgi:hypothetical protein